MLTDGKFTLNRFQTGYKQGDIFHLRPFGDVHRDSSAFSTDKWREFLDSSQTLTKPLFIGMGDYFDSYSTSERIILNNDAIHDTTKKNFEKIAKQKVYDFADEIGFMKGHLLGLLGGNHYIQFPDGTTSDMMLARLLETKYLGACTAMRLSFVPQKSHHGYCAIDIFAHHGKGAGMTTTGRMAAVEKLPTICEADIFLMGHNHSRGVLPLGDKLRLDTNKRGLYIKARRSWIGRTGGFLRGYVPDEASYITDGAMPPTSLGWIEFTLKPTRIHGENNDRQYVDIGAIQ